MSFFKSLANLFGSKPDPPKSHNQQVKSHHEPVPPPASQTEKSDADAAAKKTPPPAAAATPQAPSPNKNSRPGSSKKKDERRKSKEVQPKSDTDKLPASSEASGRKKGKSAESSKKKKSKKIDSKGHTPSADRKKLKKPATSPQARKRGSDDVFPSEALKSGSMRRDASKKNQAASPGSGGGAVPMPKGRKIQGSGETTDVTVSVMGTLTTEANESCAESSKKRSTKAKLKKKPKKKESKEKVKEPKEEQPKSFSGPAGGPKQTQTPSPQNRDKDRDKDAKQTKSATAAAAAAEKAKLDKEKAAREAEREIVEQDLDEDIPGDDSGQMSQVLDRPEVLRLVTELTPQDRVIQTLDHDPFLPMDVLMQRANDFYSEKRAKINAAITYEKFSEYEFASSKEGGVRDPNDKLSVKIYGKISREHFDVQTREKVKQDITDVVDHEPGSNRPPESG